MPTAAARVVPTHTPIQSLQRMFPEVIYVALTRVRQLGRDESDWTIMTISAEQQKLEVNWAGRPPVHKAMYCGGFERFMFVLLETEFLHIALFTLRTLILLDKL